MTHYLTVGEAAKYLRLKPSTVYKLVSAKKIEHFKSGRRTLFTVQQLDTYMDARLVNPIRGGLHVW